MPTSPRSDGVVPQRRFALKQNVVAVSGDRVDAVSTFPNRGDRALSFFIPRTSNRLVNLSNVALHMKVRLVAGMEGGALDAAHDYFIPGFSPSTIFGSVVIRANDTEITNAAHYPLLTKFLFLTRLDRERRELLCEVNDFNGQWDEENLPSRMEDVSEEEEEAGEAAAGADGAPAAKKKKKKKVRVWGMSQGRFPQSAGRSMVFKRDGGRGTVTYSTFVLTELTGDKDLILPPCDLTIDFVPAEPSRVILCTMPAPNTRVEIMSAHLNVPRIQPKTERPLSLRWNYLRTKIIPLIVPADRMEHHAVLLYSGLIGRRVSFFVLGGDNWEGTYRNSIYRSHNMDVETVELRLGSRVIPSSRIRANFDAKETGEMYMHVREALKHSLRRSGTTLNKDNWESGGFLWAADSTVDQSADAGYKSVQETGSVNLSIHFAKKTPRQLVLAVVVESIGELVLESDGNVSVSD